MDPTKLRNLLDRSQVVRDRGARFFNKALNNRFHVANATDEMAIDIYDEIGFYGVQASDIRWRLKNSTAPTVRVRINSPGGDAFEGLAIHNDLRASGKKIIVEIVALAASAASVIAMAGDEIYIADNAFIMIHNAWGLSIGDKHVMAEFAELLEQIDGGINVTYAQRTGLSTKEIAKMMDDETWLDAPTAREKGFATVGGTVEDDKVAALFDLSAFNRVPSALKNKIEDGLRDAGFSRTEAKRAITAGFGKLGQRDAGQEDDQRDAGHAAMVAELEALLAKTKSNMAA